MQSIIKRCFVVVLLFCSVALYGVAEARQPNIVVILADDQGWGDLSANGNRDLKTPHIDSLAADGAAFDHFYVCAVCAPTRAEFLTGRYHLRGGVRGVSTGAERLDLDEVTLADILKAGGYATGCFGKWHNGMQYPYHPRGRGFDRFVGFCSGHWGQYFDCELERDGEYFQSEGYINDTLTDEAIGFIKSNRDQPFFCYLPLVTPHSPMQVPDAYWERFADKALAMDHRQQDNHTRAALAMVENVDDNVGRVLDVLDELAMADDTIVIYFSDNGPNGRRWNNGMRGIKGSVDEGGLRSPLHIRWPDRIEAGMRVHKIAGAIDLLPTLLAMTGVERVGDKPMDGVSLWPLLSGEMEARHWPERMLYSHQSGRVSIRTQQYRLDDKGRLYDMLEDPGQTRNIALDQPAVADRLRAAAAAWSDEVGVGRRAQDRPFSVGHADWPVTELPSRDARFEGGLERSSRHPNCSYLLNWSSKEGRIRWDVEVLEPGEYEIWLAYACPAKDVGASIVATLGESQVEALITAAHDPPLIGKEDDRSPRTESYVKDFKLMKLGAMRLEAGRGTLEFRAANIPGSQVAEVRRVIIKRAE